jgi:hypothetical protein
MYTSACAWMIKMENLTPQLSLPELLEFQCTMLIKVSWPMIGGKDGEKGGE